MRRTAEEMNKIKQKMLDFCVTAKPAHDIAYALNLEINSVYMTARALAKEGYMEITIERKGNYTFRFNLTLIPIYKADDIEIIALSAPNVTRVNANDYHTNLKAPNEKRKSGRVHVGISTIYEG